MSKNLEPDTKLNTEAADTLFARLSELRGQNVALNAAGVQFLGGLCFQLLLAARQQWQADGCHLEIVKASVDFQDGMAGLGVSLDDFSKGP
jgi:chemotaxis protein CheX